MDKFENNSCPVPNGILLVIGGHEDKDESAQHNGGHPEILKHFIDLLSKRQGTIEVITTASSVGEESFKDYEKIFAKMGIKQVGHIHHNNRTEVRNDELQERLQKAIAVFFTGGDQLKLTSIYGGTDFLLQLKQRYIYERLLIAGTSAGAMAMSTPMIYAGNKEVQQITGMVKITVGLEFMKDICIDTHFVDRSRFVRMAQVIATNPTSIGIGIEENTALVVREGRDVEVIGSGVVIIIEGFDVSRSNVFDGQEQDRFAIENLKVHILSKGSEYELPKNNPPHI